MLSQKRHTEIAQAIINPVADPGRPESELVTRRTKLSPPALPPYCVDRRVQLALLDQASKHTLTLISAPAGSGKTTLLTQWRNQPHAILRIAWLTLDHHDNAPRFFASLCAALMAVDVALPEHLPQNWDDVSFLAALTQALDALNDKMDAPTQVAIIIDDMHTVQATDVITQLRFVIAHSPSHVRWILSGRGLPDLHASTLALRDQLYCIDGARLDGDAPFIGQVAHHLGVPLTANDTQALLLQTEGWLAGIKLALKPITKHWQEDTHAYFADVLNTQPLHRRQFVLTCSTVDRISGDLAAALVGERGQALLDETLQAQLFLRRDLSSDSGEYRFIGVFLEFLRRTAQREIADQAGELHARASRWYATQHRYEEALQHAFQCTDREWRLDLLARTTSSYAKSGAIEQALAWSQRLPSADLFAREALWTTHATALILSRRFPAAVLVLQEAAARHATHALVGNAIQTKLQTLQLMLSLLSNRVSDDDVTHCPLEGADFYLTGTLMSLQAYWLLHQQKFDAARRRALQARELLLSQGSQYGATHANAILCAALTYTAQYDAALDHCEHVFAIVDNTRGLKACATASRNTAWANAAIALAQARYEQNRLTDAQALCLAALPKLASVSSVHAFVAGNIVLARTYTAPDQFPEAWRVLDELHGYLETGRSQYLLAQLCYEKILLFILHGRTADADGVAAEFSLDALEAQSAWHAAGSRDLFIDPALARLGCAQATRLLHAGQHDRCQTILRTLIADATNIGYLQRLTVLESLHAVSLHHTQHPQAAQAALQRALALASEQGFTRRVFDEVPALNHFIASTVSSGQVTLPPKYFERFADIFGTLAHSSRPPLRRAAPPPIDPLTDREAAVLRLLSQGLTNREICARSNIALTTTKWHLKNIFAKLDVGTRTAALARARTLQLLE